MRTTESARASSAVGRALATASVHVVAAHALADAQVEDRRVVDRVALEQHDGVGELEVRHGRLQRGVGERALDVERQLAAGARGEVARAEPSRNSRASRNASSLEVSPPASAAALAPAFLSALPAASSAFSQLAGIRFVPSRTSGVVMRSSTWIDW